MVGLMKISRKITSQLILFTLNVSTLTNVVVIMIAREFHWYIEAKDLKLLLMFNAPFSLHTDKIAQNKHHSCAQFRKMN